MSHTLYEQDGLTVTEFAGGVERGKCVSIDVYAYRGWGENPTMWAGGEIELTLEQVAALVPVLIRFLGESK